MRLKIRRLVAGLGLSIFLFIGLNSRAQPTTTSITGKWRIVKIVPTHNAQCWDASQAKALVGTTVTYQPHLLVWRGGVVPISDALSRTQSRRSFFEEYKVDLPALGIAAQTVEEIDLQHDDADITGATTEVPGDTVVVAGRGRIVVSVCGVFYSAIRVIDKPTGAR